MEKVRKRRSSEEGMMKKVRRRRSDGEGLSEKVRQRRSIGEGPTEKETSVMVHGSSVAEVLAFGGLIRPRRLQ